MVSESEASASRALASSFVKERRGGRIRPARGAKLRWFFLQADPGGPFLPGSGLCA